MLRDPGFWCDGTPPGAPPMTPRQQATLNAGEILSTLAGHRGVVMTQLWAGWNDDEARAVYSRTRTHARTHA